MSPSSKSMVTISKIYFIEYTFRGNILTFMSTMYNIIIEVDTSIEVIGYMQGERITCGRITVH